MYLLLDYRLFNCLWVHACMHVIHEVSMLICGCSIMKRHTLLLLCLFVSANSMIDDIGASNRSACKLWHYLRNGHCYCGTTDHGVVKCDNHFISVKQGSCVTWSNATGSAEVHRCLFTKWSDYTCVKHDFYEISTTISGEELNYFTCDDYNRQGRYCSHCIDGYAWTCCVFQWRHLH